jgi:hypothetical protein
MPSLNNQSQGEGHSSQKMLSPFLRIALLVGVCVHLVGFLLFHVISNPLPTREENLPFVQYVSPNTLSSGAELEEQVALFDSAPLFVPGQWNAAHNLQPPSRDRALFRFPAYGEPESANFSSALVGEGLPVGLSYPVTEPIDLLALRYWDLFRGFGQEAPEPKALESTGVFAEARSLSGKVLRTAQIEVELLSMQAVQPSTYFLRVEAGGRPVGRATLSSSSGDATFDAAAYTWLVQSGFAAGLPAGFFEIRIYP